MPTLGEKNMGERPTNRGKVAKGPPYSGKQFLEFPGGGECLLLPPPPTLPPPLKAPMLFAGDPLTSIQLQCDLRIKDPNYLTKVATD